MRLLIGFFGLFTLLLLVSAIELYKSLSPEKLLVGKWQETSWEYAKVNHNGDLKNFQLPTDHKDEIYKNFVIHDSEIWEFDRNGSLILSGTQNPKERLRWSLKGRGNVLELTHNNQGIENYQIQQITNGSLVIHFNIDLQVRGIVSQY